MSFLPTHLGDRFVSLAQAARLAARRRDDLAPIDAKEMLARAIFGGAFDPPVLDDCSEENIKERGKRENWLQVPIETPPARLPPDQAPLKPRPEEYYAAGRGTVASVMESLGGLPGDKDQWGPLLETTAGPEPRHLAFSALARTPWRHYPARGRAYLKSIRIPVAKFEQWFAVLGNNRSLSGAADLAYPASAAAANPKSVRSQGRPQKAAWSRIREVALIILAENPKIQMKGLAFDVRSAIAKEFPEDEVPSLATIQRKLCEILRGGSLH